MSAYTEEEAKTKACCKIMPTYQGELVTAACLASKCMAWRWSPAGTEKEVQQSRLEGYQKKGYCGLAGKPLWYEC